MKLSVEMGDCNEMDTFGILPTPPSRRLQCCWVGCGKKLARNHGRSIGIRVKKAYFHTSQLTVHCVSVSSLSRMGQISRCLLLSFLQRYLPPYQMPTMVTNDPTIAAPM